MIILNIKVKPGSKFSSIDKSNPDLWIIKLKESPVDGKANESLIRILAEEFHVTKSSVEIIHGHKNRNKRVRIMTSESGKK